MKPSAHVLLATTALVAGILGLPDLAHAAQPAGDIAAAAAAEGNAMLTTFDPALPPQSGAQSALRILIMMTALSLLPALVMTMTSFARIVIVFSFLKQALGVQGMPPTQIIVGMSLFLTFFIMAPVGERIHTEAIQPLSENQISMMESVEKSKAPVAEFMLSQVADKDLRLFYDISKRSRPQTREEVEFVVLVPAFIL